MRARNNSSRKDAWKNRKILPKALELMVQVRYDNLHELGETRYHEGLKSRSFGRHRTSVFATTPHRDARVNSLRPSLRGNLPDPASVRERPPCPEA